MKYWLLFVMIISAGMTPAAYPQPPEPPEEVELAREMEAARKAMQEAAQHYAELAASRADRIIRNVQVERIVQPRVRLGVVLENNSQGHDIVVRNVAEQGPAAQAGLKPGDVLLAIGDNSLDAEDKVLGNRPAWRVRHALANANPGDEVVVRFLRDGAEHEATVVLAAAQPMFDESFLEDLGDRVRMAVRPGMESLQLWMGRPLGGLELVRMSEGLGRYFGTEDGLLVVRAPEDNLLGVRDGDVILNIDGRVPESPVHAMRILRSYAPGEQLSMDVMRDRQRESIEVTIPERSG